VARVRRWPVERAARSFPPTPRSASRVGSRSIPRAPRFAHPDSYTPKCLAERILTSRAALEGERKRVTVLFADLKGSMELLADRDPEDARKLLDPLLEDAVVALGEGDALDYPPL